MARLTAIAFAILTTLPTSAHADTVDFTRWLQAEVEDSQPGDWASIPIDPEPLAAKTKADILIESLGNYATAQASGDVTLKRGLIGHSASGGAVVLGLEAWEIELVSDSLPSGKRQHRPFTIIKATHVSPEGDTVVLDSAIAGYLVAEVMVDATGAELLIPTDIVVDFDQL